MLNLDSIKTRTIYSKAQIQSLNFEFKNKLNEAYAEQTQPTIYQALSIIKMFFYLGKVPHFLKELNDVGEIQMLSLLQILFMKCSQWKSEKQIVQKWVGTLMAEISQYEPSYHLKPQIKVCQIEEHEREQNILFFSQHLEYVGKGSNIDSMAVAIAFLRVFLIDLLQNKKYQLKLIQDGCISAPWKIVNENLIKIAACLQNIKGEQICVSICYWLCSVKKQFILQCVLKGIINFLCQSLSDKNISEWYGKKIIAFLKLLFLGGQVKAQYFSLSEFQICLARFTMKYDNQIIIQHARSLFTHIGNTEGKIEQQQNSYKKYQQNKNPKTSQRAAQDLRILLLYSEELSLKNQLEQEDNEKAMEEILKKEDGVEILNQVFNVIAYNYKYKGEKKEVFSNKIIEKVGYILSQSGYKQDLVGKKKKLLISFIRMLKQLLQNRQKKQHVVYLLNSNSIVKKLKKFSDCTNFRYQRQLFSLINLIAKDSPNQASSPSKNKSDSSEVMKALVKHLNQGGKKVKKNPIEDQLEQVQLFYEMIERGQTGNIKDETISAVMKKVKVTNEQTQQIQISILDSSETGGNREMVNKINYFAIGSLEKLQNLQETKGVYELNEKDLKKLIDLGLTTQDPQVLKVVTGYLAQLYNQNRLNEEQKQQFMQIYKRYKEKFGDQCQIQIDYINQQKQKGNKLDLITLIELLKTRKLSEQQKIAIQTQLYTLQEDQQAINNILSKLSHFQSPQIHNNLMIFLTLLLQVSKNQKYKPTIFKHFSSLLSNLLVQPSTAQTNQKNSTIYRIMAELFAVNLSNNMGYFQKILHLSYQHVTKQSIQFTDLCLEFFQYSGDQKRQEKYWNFIYNDPDGISRQAALIIQTQKQKQLQEKFWTFFKKQVEQRVEEEKRLTLHFLEVFGKNAQNDIWKKYQLINLLEKLFFVLKTRSEQVFTKTPTELLMKKMLRLSKTMLCLSENQGIQLNQFLLSQYKETTHILITHPMLSKHSSRMGQISSQHIKNMVKILKSQCRRRQGYEQFKGHIDVIDSVAEKVSEYKSSQMNDIMLQIFRILMLLEQDGENFGHIYKMLNDNKNKLTLAMTEKGTEHLEACDRIAAYILNKHLSKVKEEYLKYFFPNMKFQQIQKQVLTFTDSELLKHLKNLLSPPYQYGLNLLEKHLRLVESSDFANTLVKIFVNSASLYQQNGEDRTKTLDEVQEKIVESIWAQECELNSDFYKMIDKNIIGLKICLRTRKIGLQGVKIVGQKFFQYPSQVPLCSQILHLNVHSTKQWVPVHDKKIPSLINKVYAKDGVENCHYVECVGNLIGSSSKLKPIQNDYKVQQDLFKNLQLYLRDRDTLSSTLYAISGLVYLHEKNQEHLGSKEKIKFYLKIVEQYNNDTLIFEKCCNLLSNLVFKNPKMIPILTSLKTQSCVIGVANNIDYVELAFKQFLRLIGNMSIQIQSATMIVKADFLKAWSQIINKADHQHHDHIIQLCFDILFNLLNFHEIEAKSIAYKAYQAYCPVKIINYLLKNSLNTQLVNSGLDALEKLFILDVNRTQAIQNQIITCLEEIAKTQSWNEVKDQISQFVFERWVRVVYSLLKEPKNIQQIIKSEILNKCSLFLRGHGEIKNDTLLLLIEMIDILYNKANHQQLANHGYIELLVQLLKIKKLKASFACFIIDTFTSFHEKNILQSGSYIKIFQGLIHRLQIEFRDENAQKIINLLIKIRDKIVMNTKAATILLEFGYMFLTQKELITSQKYHKRVRQFICLLSYFIAFSIELKIIFREQGFIEILESWIKIDKSLDEDNSVSQACRVCIFTIQNQQRFLVNVGEDLRDGTPFYSKLEKGRKCLLYRRNHTNKNAIIKLKIPKKNCPELVAFKAPDGEIKEKYTVPLFQIIGMRSFDDGDDKIYKESVFASPGGIFQKDATCSNCLTIIGIVGEQLSIRQLDVQFVKKGEKQQFLQNFKVATSIQFKEKKSSF